MKNEKEAAAFYGKKYYTRHDNAGAFYASDFYEVLDVKNVGGGCSGHPLQHNSHSARSGLYDRLQQGTAGLQEAERLIAALTPRQQNGLLGFLDAVTAKKNGTTTNADVLRYILDLPQEDIAAFTGIIKAIQK